MQPEKVCWNILYRKY